MSIEEAVLIKTHQGDKEVEFFVRPGTTDEGIIREVWEDNYYFEGVALRPKYGDVVIDIGGHVGSFTILCAKYGAGVEVYEPDDENFKLLLKNADANGLFFSNQILFNNLAVTSDGRNVFLKNPDKVNTGKVGIFPESEGEQKALSQDIHSIIVRHEEIDILKLDCEGSEYEILKVMTKEDFSKIKFITGEFHLDYPQLPESNLEWLRGYLKKFYRDVIIGYAEGTLQGRFQAFNFYDSIN